MFGGKKNLPFSPEYAVDEELTSEVLSKKLKTDACFGRNSSSVHLEAEWEILIPSEGSRTDDDYIRRRLGELGMTIVGVDLASYGNSYYVNLAPGKLYWEPAP